MRLTTIGLIMTLALGILLAPHSAEAQGPMRVRRIGVLSSFSPYPEPARRLAVFRQSLHDLGYVEGQNLTIEYRWAEGNVDRLPTLADELIRLKVEVIVPVGTSAIYAAKQAMTTIPIVIQAVVDPVGGGFVASLARPGGNITGISTLVLELSGKLLKLLKEAVPRGTRVAVLWGRYRDGTGVGQFHEVTLAAQALGVELQSLEVRGADEFESAFAAATREGAGALLMLPSTLFNANENRLAALAVKSRLPAMFRRRSFTEAGGLMAYGPRESEVWRRAATYVDKILKGATPADLPVEQAMKFELVINLKTAQALGLTLPPHFLALADEVIR